MASTLGTINETDRYSNYATESLENTVRLSNARNERIKKNFRAYAPEASAAYFVEIQLEQED